MSLTELKNAVNALSPEDQGDLASWIIDRLPPHSSEDASDESLVIAEERAAELDSGEVMAISHEELIASVKRHRSG